MTCDDLSSTSESEIASVAIDLSQDSSDLSVCGNISDSDDDISSSVCAIAENIRSIDSLNSDSLYDGASITTFESHLLSFQYAIRHSLTNVAFTELLELIDAHLPTSKAPTSVYRLKKIFLGIFPQVKSASHKYCADCHHLLSDEEVCSTINCRQSRVDKFITIPLEAQLRQVIQGMIHYSIHVHYTVHVYM